MYLVINILYMLYILKYQDTSVRENFIKEAIKRYFFRVFILLIE